MNEEPEPGRFERGVTRTLKLSKQAITWISTQQQWRHIWMLFLSAIIIGIILFTSFQAGREIFCPDESNSSICVDQQRSAEQDVEEARMPPTSAPGGARSLTDEARSLAGRVAGDPRRQFLWPYLTNLAGVLLFVLNTARRKEEEWKLRNHWGEHVFRIAQSFAYLFVILWAWPSLGDKEVVTARLGPHVLGFLVGLYINRIERVMFAFGVKLEDILSTALPQTLGYETPDQRQRKQLRAVYRVEDITTQWETLRPQIEDPGAREQMDARIREAQEMIQKARETQGGDDERKARHLTDALVLLFEEMKRTAGEVRVPLEELLPRG